MGWIDVWEGCDLRYMCSYVCTCPLAGVPVQWRIMSQSISRILFLLGPDHCGAVCGPFSSTYLFHLCQETSGTLKLLTPWDLSQCAFNYSLHVANFFLSLKPLVTLLSSH